MWMTRQQLPPQIRKVDVLDRKTSKTVVRYELRVDGGVNTATRQRQQVKRRFTTEKQARDALAEIGGQSTQHTFVARGAVTVEQVCSDWLAGKHRIKPTTRAAYEHALAPLRQRHGDLPVQQLTKQHVDQLVSDLMAGKCDGGCVAGRGARGGRRKWTANSINPMLNIVSAVLTDLVKQGLLTRDVAALVDRLARPKLKMRTFTQAEVKTLLHHVETDRLAHAWHLALSGLRRGEVAGLRWSDVDLDAGTVTIAHNRVSVNGKPYDSDPKTENSARTLPLTPALTLALRRAATVQKTERLALGPAYSAGDHVVCDEAGRPYHPDTISDYWRTVCKDAKVPKIRLHDARHTCGTLMHLQGLPIVIISQWLGHADPAFTMRTYVHSQSDSLNIAAATLQQVVSP
jgi:integrase